MASDLGRSLVELVSDRRAFPDQAARDLIRLLGATLAQRDPASARWDVLGPLVQLISEMGALPTVAQYDAFRRERRTDALAGSTLTERYGSWLSALTNASNFMSLSLEKPARPYKKPWHKPYTPAECLAAMAQFRKRFGEWPRPTEYREWSNLARRAARECGGTDPCLPDLKVILNRFGSFDNALGAAKSMYGEGP